VLIYIKTTKLKLNMRDEKKLRGSLQGREKERGPRKKTPTCENK